MSAVPCANLRSSRISPLADTRMIFPAFQSLVWGNKTPEEALAVAIFETVGEA